MNTLKNKSYKLVIFDLDGTILNTLDDLADSLNAVFKMIGYQKRTVDEVRSFVGNGVMKLIERAVPKDTSKEDILKTFKMFSEYYQAHCAIKTKPYDGIIEMLHALKEKGCKIAVASNKIHPAVVSLCNDYYPGLVDVAVGDDPIRPKKPHPAMVNYVLDKLNISKENTLYVGDSDVDVLTAKNAGIDCVAVDWGFRTKEFLIQSGAGLIISNPQELIDIIE
ncbi:MAG: HAD-IIIA family hydrolase [Bacilli bacterium]|nr:HAD-IIIA family hydrolase [Bacilli bacterium]